MASINCKLAPADQKKALHRRAFFLVSRRGCRSHRTPLPQDAAPTGRRSHNNHRGRGILPRFSKRERFLMFQSRRGRRSHRTPLPHQSMWEGHPAPIFEKRKIPDVPIAARTPLPQARTPLPQARTPLPQDAAFGGERPRRSWLPPIANSCRRRSRCRRPSSRYTGRQSSKVPRVRPGSGSGRNRSCHAPSSRLLPSGRWRETRLAR